MLLSFLLETVEQELVITLHLSIPELQLLFLFLLAGYGEGSFGSVSPYYLKETRKKPSPILAHKKRKKGIEFKVKFFDMQYHVFYNFNKSKNKKSKVSISNYLFNTRKFSIHQKSNKPMGKIPILVT